MNDPPTMFDEWEQLCYDRLLEAAQAQNAVDVGGTELDSLPELHEAYNMALDKGAINLPTTSIMADIFKQALSSSPFDPDRGGEDEGRQEEQLGKNWHNRSGIVEKSAVLRQKLAQTCINVTHAESCTVESSDSDLDSEGEIPDLLKLNEALVCSCSDRLSDYRDGLSDVDSIIATDCAMLICYQAVNVNRPR
ncbi:hypothetical protein R1sor_017994 [Riccia sorocarpa]|uniref:Uncharacterized protein n=1 Tax=Riccia sorocarpa TaxID=122646 RepID=A0ABD3ICH2_9MARC